MAAFIEERNKRLVQAPDDRCSAMAALAIDACIDGQKKTGPEGPVWKAQRSVPGGDKHEKTATLTLVIGRRSVASRPKSVNQCTCSPAPAVAADAARAGADGICNAPDMRPLPARAGGLHMPQT